MFKLMASYNQVLNQRVYDAASKLDEKDLVKKRGVYFDSVLGILNHILVGDTIWLKRFADHPTQYDSLQYLKDIAFPKGLDAVLFGRLDDLREARVAMDETICGFVDELTPACVETSFGYVDTKGNPYRKNFGSLIQHLFNHQTHHRGQISALLHQSGVDIGVTDLLVSIPEDASKNESH